MHTLSREHEDRISSCAISNLRLRHSQPYFESHCENVRDTHKHTHAHTHSCSRAHMTRITDGGSHETFLPQLMFAPDYCRLPGLITIAICLASRQYFSSSSATID